MGYTIESLYGKENGLRFEPREDAGKIGKWPVSYGFNCSIC
jgi:hypothetical protein